MSGGSFNYLYTKEPFETYSRDIYAMKEDMRKEGHNLGADELYQYCLALISAKLRLAIMQERLAPLMRAWEWYRSGDQGIEQVTEEENNL